MKILRLPLGQWLPDHGENANSGLLVAKNFWPYGDSYVPSSARLVRTGRLVGLSTPLPLTGLHVNPNVDANAEDTASLILGHGTLYYGAGEPGTANAVLYAIDVDMHESALWPETLVSAGLITSGEEGWHFASFGASELAVCGHAVHVFIRVNGMGNFVKCFDTVAFPTTGEPKPKFVGVGDNRVWFANIANTGSPIKEFLQTLQSLLASGCKCCILFYRRGHC